MARLSRLSWAAPTLLTTALLATGWAIGCGNGRNDAAACVGEGCACEGEGVVAECATTLAQGSDSITCRSGTRTCTGGRWSACSQGDQVSFQSHHLSVKSTAPSACVDNPCDPDCKRFDDNPADITDGGGVALAAGGGITLGDGGAGGLGDGGTCTGLTCKIDLCGGDYTKTQLTGKVYDPAGKNPIYNVLVYIPNSTPAALKDGVSCDSCAAGSGSPIVSTLTDYTGSFTLKGVPNGTNIPLVIQSGKWRRQLTISTVTKCVSNDTTSLTGADGLKLIRFPKNRSEGDIPRIAFVSGSADPFQCVLSKMGLDVSAATSEVGVPYVSGSLNPDRIHYYQGTSSAGQNLSSTLGGGAPSASGLYDTAAHLAQYDAVILACEGGDFDKGSAINSRLVDYVTAGGRIFATHFSYRYLQSAPTASEWPQVVKAWNHVGSPASPMPALINQTFTKGDNFAKWLNFVGASPTIGQLAIQEGRHDYDYVDRTRATPWMYSNSSGALPGGSGLPVGAGCYAASECASGSCAGSSASSAITNGGFESGTTGWTISGVATSVSATSHSGAKALQLGTTTPTAAGYENSATLTFTAPASGGKLSFWYRNTCTDSVSYDWATATLQDTTAGSAAVTILPKTCTSSGTWQQITANVVPGHNYTLVLKNHDDDWPDGAATRAYSDPTYTLFDDVVLTVPGSCAPVTCKVDSDCTGGTGAACWGGACVPAHNQEPLMTFNVPITATPDKQCGRVVYSDFHVSASALNGSSSVFPTGCNGGDLSAQEKALEFMLFDLTSCLTPDFVPPAAPPTFTKTTVSRDYAAVCPVGSRPIWHFFDWQTVTPGDSSISFTVQTGDTVAALNAMTALPLATVTGPPITTWTGKDVAAVLAAATPAVANGNMLRVNITLNPTSDGSGAPILVDWRQSYSCKAEE
ncbi:MAG: hypothetical protein ACXVEE_24435 [Polyangiales bacterium]